MNTFSVYEIASRNVLAYLEAAGINDVQKYPAQLMPVWLAEKTPVLSDKLGSNGVKKISRRHGRIIGKWGLIPIDGWNRVLSRYLVRLIDRALDEVSEIAKTQEYWPAIEKAAADCKRAIVTRDKEAAESSANCARFSSTATVFAYVRARVASDADAAVAAARAAGVAHVAAGACDAFASVVDAARAGDAAYEGACADGFINYVSYTADDAAKILFTALLDEVKLEISKVCAF